MDFRRRMRPLPLSRIRLSDPFWSRWQRVLVKTTLPQQHERLETTGRLANFRRAAGREAGEFQGRFWFDDSDVYKWLEACAYGLAAHPSAELRTHVDATLELVEAAQEPTGYLNTFFQLKHPDLKWRNLYAMHEMYCGGHLIEAGVAFQESLGETRLLEVGRRFADHVMSIFGPDLKPGYCGHEEFELALVRLSEATGDPKYRDFARWQVETRGHRPSPFEPELSDPVALSLAPWGPNQFLKDGTYSGEYAQDHAPVEEHREVVGHAVRAMYLYAAAAELASTQADPELGQALERVWTNLTGRRMYVTGGIGPSPKNEGFTADYDLPNLTAYAETCASCGLIFWGQRMLEVTGNAEYADVIERTLYNGALSGISLSGDHYFYDNPLESRGEHERVPWFECACCPPNLARLIGSLGRYVAGESEDAFFVHQFTGLTAETVLNGIPTTLRIESNYPWSGRFTIHVEPQKPCEFSLYVRIPDWAEDVETDIPDAEEPADYESGYAVFRRVWSQGDTLTVDLGMEPRWVEADPRVRDNLGRAALMHGPLVYCAEEHDLGYAPQLLTVDVDAPVGVSFEERLGGVNVLTAEGVVDIELFADSLYAPVGTTDTRQDTVQLIPYFAWNNRGPNSMQVWLRRL